MIWQDIRYALRRLWHSKGFATVAILCLAFGIGLNTTIFSIVDGVLLRPYPYNDPDNILVVGSQNPKSDSRAGLSLLDMRDWKEAASSFVTIVGTQANAMTVSDGTGEPERYAGAAISWDTFPMLGTAPIVGHGFTAADAQPNAGGVVLLSYELWQRRYHGDTGIVGRTIQVNMKPHVVVGVMPPRFAFPQVQRLWVPLSEPGPKDLRDNRSLFAFGRVKPGVTRDRATHELTAIANRLAQQYPTTNENWVPWIRSLHEAFLPEEVPRVLFLMMAGVTLVLFIACSNVANLLLARAAGRRREISVRAALGAGRGRLVRQLMTESVVLGLAAVPLGILLAEVGTRLIASAMPVDQVPYYVTWQVDWRSLLYTVAIAVTTALVFGSFPSLQITRGDLHENLKEGTRGNTATRSLVRSTLVVLQVSLALVSLVGALLFVRTFLNLDTTNLGFDTRPLMTMRFYMTGDTYAAAEAKGRRAEDIVRRVETLPGVGAAFASSLVPIMGGGGGGSLQIEGRPAEPSERAGIGFVGVTPHFYQTLGIAVVHGRDFTDAEGWSRTPVAIISQAMAKKFWSEGEPVGGRFRLIDGENPNEWFTIIGVAPNFKLYGINPSRGNDEEASVAFVPYRYQESYSTGLTIRVAAGHPSSITGAVRREIRASDPNIPLYWIRTMEDVRRVSFWQYGLYGWIFGSIGVLGLLLASIGVYGVLSYSVSQRTQEIGVRVALGARRSHVLTLVVGQGVVLAGIGVVIGLVLAAAGMPLARTLLYNVSPFDPFTFTVVSGFLVAVALIASYLPARRATRVDPVIALRGE